MSNFRSRKVQLARNLVIGPDGHPVGGYDRVIDVQDHEKMPESIEEVHDLLHADDAEHGPCACDEGACSCPPGCCECSDPRACLDACLGLIRTLESSVAWCACRKPRR